ncbi:Csu type fimbrial protein [Yersinia kristensenii]|uniref:Spore coat protein U n=1 Tax=Yersinia kristensenii TaxID=28152 RepID=A0AB73NTB6_YERKR|nr:spore coat protein U domain-containing protein [Yersinia kristensenii]OVZ79531.1 spore coat protein U [Yersinia kristensenii]CND80327.1 sigma-fimbriae tip adhesin [Yersinia kristensenii]CNG50051.1 sigma-fimbriae tip adhesin [Yersinia kristensenii]CNK27689.1 sigma-fimbriae tip adhesin [Yersinia kristensenii]
MTQNKVGISFADNLSAIIALLILLAGLIAPAARADSCTFSPGTVTLPPSSSVAAGTTAVNAQGSSAMSCSGALITIGLLGTFSLSATISSTTNSLNLKNAAGDLIPYSIYRTGSFNPALKVGDSLDYSSASLLSINLGSLNASLPIYIRTGVNGVISSNISAGTYTDVITLGWHYNICKVLNLLGACIGSWSGNGTGTDITTVTVTLIVSKDCAINSTPDVNFGGFALVGQFNPVSQNITLTCTKGSTFNTYVTAGDNPVTNWRQMKLNSTTVTDYLQYQLYQGASGSTLWDSTSMQSGSGTGAAQLVPYHAVINANQHQRTPGDYQDNVSLVLVY